MNALLPLLLALGSAVSSHDGHKHDGHKHDAAAPASVTVTGEVLDMDCYMGHGGSGKEHKTCAQACLTKKGSAAGLLSADGAVYLLVADHSREKEYLPVRKLGGEQVKVTGKVQSKGGVQALVVEKVEKAK